MDTTKLKTNHKWISIAIGFVYLWFGALKFVPNLSPAEGLAKNTIHQLTFGLLPDEVSIILLAIWEVGLGILLISQLYRRIAVIVAIVHMVLTFTPFLFFPDEVFGTGPFALTLVGQYIVKNVIVLAALLSIYERKKVKVAQFQVKKPEENVVYSAGINLQTPLQKTWSSAVKRDRLPID
ncbi:DoxX family protein [Allomuricauda sp. M10]|uniref:DoxX family protein n=1 Tax=Allomuricauda sp. M10 TaxID=2683292 RepID=UPI001D17D838|nr:DoxX family protein [Muricauda sp. M10]